MKKLLLLVVVSVFFTSCASTGYSAKQNEPGGFVAGSITIKDTAPRYDSYKLMYQPYEQTPSLSNSYNLVTVKSGTGMFSRNFSNADEIVDGEATFYFVKRLKPGDYYISSFYAEDYDSSPMLGASFGAVGVFFSAALNKQDPKKVYYPFIVREGEITYLGEFYYDGSRKGMYDITDQSKRDISALDYLYPQLQDYKMYKADFKYLKNH